MRSLLEGRDGGRGWAVRLSREEKGRGAAVKGAVRRQEKGVVGGGKKKNQIGT
jgi:hypothetical protein